VLFVFREEYYLERSQPRENTEEHKLWQQGMEMVTGKADVIIGKQRHGPTGTVTLQFTPEFTRFSNLASEERLPERRE
jgi:replicative DNA helicase